MSRPGQMRSLGADYMGPPLSPNFASPLHAVGGTSTISRADLKPSTGAPLPPTTKGSVPYRKRRRRIIACLACHRRRVKCDFGRPCSACVKHGVEDTCAYEEPAQSKRSSADDSGSGAEVDDDGDDEPGEGQVHTSMPQPRASITARHSSTSSIANESSASSSLRRTSNNGITSISPQSFGDDTSPSASSGSSLAARMFIKAKQDNAPPVYDPRLTSSFSISPNAIHLPQPVANVAEAQRNDVSSASSVNGSVKYSRAEAEEMRAACAAWPEAKRLPSVVKFFLNEINGLLIMMEDLEVNAFTERRVIPLLELRHDAEAFYNRLRPGDATKLAMTATMIANCTMKCSLGALALWFASRLPGERVTLYTAATRDRLSKTLKSSTKTLLDACLRDDAPDYGQVRAVIAFVDLLKGEGTLAGAEAQVWFPALTKAARACKLHQEPASEVGADEREMHRRLFVSFVSTNWYGASTFGIERFPATEMGTTFPQKMLNREHECLMLRFRMGRLFSPISQAARNVASEWRYIDDIEDDLNDTIRSFPADLRPTKTVDQSVTLYNDTDSATMNLQKHLLRSFYFFLRGLTHRMRFFKHPDIPVERVRYSREACIDSAKGILWTQQEFRAQYFSDAWLRGFHFVYFTLEPSVILALAALTTLGDAETDETTETAGSTVQVIKAWEGSRLQSAVAKARSLLDWSQRGADLMSTLPMDVTTNVQAGQFIERLVTKATHLVDWYEAYARSSNGPRMPIFSAASATKHMLSDNDGRPLQNALLDTSLRGMNMERDEDEVKPAATADPILAAAPIAPLDAAASFAGLFGGNIGGVHDVVNSSALPALLDYGSGGFDSLSFSLPRPTNDKLENMDLTTMLETAPPLEEQIDVWLALLQQ